MRSLVDGTNQSALSQLKPVLSQTGGFIWNGFNRESGSLRLSVLVPKLLLLMIAVGVTVITCLLTEEPCRKLSRRTALQMGLTSTRD